MMIREYLGYDKFDVEFNLKEKSDTVKSSNNVDLISPNSIMVDNEGIHVGPTRNYTRYMESALKSSIKSWTYPYKKPLIMHHNEKDGKIIGRINSVYYTDVNTRSGTGALVFVTNVPDKDGIEQIEDGRLTTTSVGIIGHDVRCSICGQNIAEEGPCEHERGQVYDKNICYWDIYEMEGKELSYVIVPSDVYTNNVRVYRPSQSTHIKESLNLNEGVYSKMDEAEIKKLQESVKTLEDSNTLLLTEKATLEAELKESQENEVKIQKELENIKESSVPSETEVKLKEEKETAELALKEATDALKIAEQNLESKNLEIADEKTLREAAENNAVEIKESSKQALVENYTLLRKLAGKADVTPESIQERTQDSLVDAIKDIKEELGSGFNIATINLMTDPTITESKGEDVKKEKNLGNIDLQEGLNEIFDNITNRHYKK